MEDLISDVSLNLLVNGASNRLAWGNVTLFGRVRVNITIVKGKSGEAFVSWPNYSTEKDGQTKWSNYVHFVELEDFRSVNESIMQVFNRLIEGPAAPPPVVETVVEPKTDVKKSSVWSKKK